MTNLTYLLTDFSRLLFIKKSNIPRAGLGLYTSKKILKGEIIAEYQGKIYSWDKCLERAYDEDKEGYVFYIDKEHCIDAYDYPESLARYANDAEGYYRVKGIKNNSEYITKNGSVFIVATCDINSYSEIFTPYGEQYWEDFEPDDDMD
ncbi:MAG: hypothetical protein OZ913_02485 [Ignavibacteriaceae bacterium]|jgi:hypothetical protein|nr:MAG: SET domain-containing protein [Chlorobiota bacterium]KXK06074.1 MAG: hypothetical protein UZ04_CHB001000070 [Chlorobi bacterium OLB4]MBV6398507.1 hypothetical protein [Ignavibacteria bacterium]MCC6885741.1 hypothetical protein [Ignavibacteriales bacterium]MCE7953064.1 SET domain-containing protein [Chlorobi bacterium CHB7]MDL1887098.1 SET domain-containing protein [Ignavibacteria bacterium CHB1]MEB2329153.1 hypothetical protein [Ignavibacteriaceae bacterium]OQY77991.1 MAG: hypothetic